MSIVLTAHKHSSLKLFLFCLFIYFFIVVQIQLSAFLFAINHGHDVLAFLVLGSRGWSLWSRVFLISFSPLVIQGHQRYLLLAAILCKRWFPFVAE